MGEEKTGAKSVLITGGAGFIGSHLAEFLLARGFNVMVLDELRTGTRANIQHLLWNPRFHFAQTGISNEVVLDRLASEAHTIVHLAGARPAQMPADAILTNTSGTEAVLDAAQRYGCVTFLAGETPHSGSRWSFAVSQMVNECLGLAYYRAQGSPVVMARMSHIVGPRQRGNYGTIARMMRQALEGRPITVFGDGSERRCFCDVRDAVQAIWLLAQNPAALGNVFGIGGQSEISMLDLARKIRTIARSRSEIVRIPYEPAYDAGFEDTERRVPDTTKVASCAGWRHRIPLDETLAQIRDWSKAHPEPESVVMLEAPGKRGWAQPQLRFA